MGQILERPEKIPERAWLYMSSKERKIASELLELCAKYGRININEYMRTSGENRASVYEVVKILSILGIMERIKGEVVC